jgi:hypothetical protein
VAWLERQIDRQGLHQALADRRAEADGPDGYNLEGATS